MNGASTRSTNSMAFERSQFDARQVAAALPDVLGEPREIRDRAVVVASDEVESASRDDVVFGGRERLGPAARNQLKARSVAPAAEPSGRRSQTALDLRGGSRPRARPR